jgi:hypothetical protein
MYLGAGGLAQVAERPPGKHEAIEFKPQCGHMCVYVCACVCVFVHAFMYIYIYICISFMYVYRIYIELKFTITVAKTEGTGTHSLFTISTQHRHYLTFL